MNHMILLSLSDPGPLDALNAWLKSLATSSVTTLGWLGVLMLVISGMGTIYYIAARSLAGVLPMLWRPVSGEWARTTLIVFWVGTAILTALWSVIMVAIRSGGFRGFGG